MTFQLKKLFENERLAFTGLFVITLLVSLQQYFLGADAETGYTHYNNYVIFKHSFSHLIHDQDIYGWFLKEHWDLYKYSPSFSLFMGFFAFLPDVLGLFLWNLLNVMILAIGIWKLPFFSNEKKYFIFGIVVVELVTSIQNSQSNALVVGLFLLAFGLLENKKIWLATLMIVLSVYIKLFGLLAFPMFIFYPNKLKSIYTAIIWFAVLAILPLLVVSPEQLLFLYKSWLKLLTEDHGASLGLSVMAWLQTWFSLEISKNLAVLFGAILLLLPLIRRKFYENIKFRLLFLSSLLIWTVIFNHKAESPTFIIAVAGVAIWFVVRKRNILEILLLGSVLILTSLSPTDIFPKSFRDNFITPYVLKAVPCILLWVTLLAEQFRFKNP